MMHSAWLSLGHPAFHSVVLVLLLTWSPGGGGWEARASNSPLRPPLVKHAAGVGACRSWHPLAHALAQTRWRDVWGLTSRSACKLRGLARSTATAPGNTPTSMCEVAFSPSACKGPICHRKRPLLFFFCILINTEEAGAVKFILGKTSELFYLVSWNLLLLSIHD